tara:strand:+ start:3736 stop:3996 length:261 start_codon:yes stop_codon:yes gene_type:complete
MAKKVRSTKDKLTKNKNAAKNKQKMEKPPKAKKASVMQQYPKAKNKDSLTPNIQSKSGKSVKDSGLGKIQRVAMSHKLNLSPKRKK